LIRSSSTAPASSLRAGHDLRALGPQGGHVRALRRPRGDAILRPIEAGSGERFLRFVQRDQQHALSPWSHGPHGWRARPLNASPSRSGGVSYIAVRHYGLTPTAVAAQLGISRRSVARAFERAQQLGMDSDAQLSELLT
jgi:AraC-like DNA-binding protein